MQIENVVLSDELWPKQYQQIQDNIFFLPSSGQVVFASDDDHGVMITHQPVGCSTK